MVEVDLAQESAFLNEHTFNYRTPTLAGSSGAPIFNKNWELIGIHVGRGKSANFGINIKAIIDDAKQKLLGIAITEEVAIKIKETMDRGKRKYSSVFISYNHSDSVFANRLYNGLQANGIRAWIDTESMLPGDNIYEKIQEGIQQNDKVLLCCSKPSLESGWVDSEINRILQKEWDLFKASGKKQVLIPLNLDNFMIQGWQSAMANDVLTRKAADFIDWEDETKFEKAFNKLLQALQKSQTVD
jgi:hypothetical protein